MKNLIYKFKQWLISKLKVNDILNYIVNKVIADINDPNEKYSNNLGINYLIQYKYLINDFNNIDEIPFEVKANTAMLYYINYTSCNFDSLIDKLKKDKFIYAIDLTDKDLFVDSDDNVMKYFKLDDNIQYNTVNKKYYDFKAMHLQSVFDYYLHNKNNKFNKGSKYYTHIIGIINNKKEIKLYYANPEIIGKALIPNNSRNKSIPCVNTICYNGYCLVTHEKYFTSEWKDTYNLKEITNEYQYLLEELNNNRNKINYAVNKLNKHE